MRLLIGLEPNVEKLSYLDQVFDERFHRRSDQADRLELSYE